MPGLLTEITEVATALGASGAPDLDTALERPPSGLVNVAGSVIEALRQAHLDTAFQKDFAGAWENGRAFFESDDGLRGRVPLTIEWKGPHRAPGYDNLPVDLRIDHVYLQRGALQPLEARIVLDREGAPGVWPSDHFGVYVRFAFAPR